MDIAAISGITGVSERGQQVIAEMQEEIEAVRAQANGTIRPRVYCEEWGKPLITSQFWVAELVEAAGGEFIGTPVQKSPVSLCYPRIQTWLSRHGVGRVTESRWKRLFETVAGLKCGP